MTDDFSIITSLDQPVSTIDAGDTLKKVEQIIEKSVLEHSPEPAISAINKLREISQLSGLALAKLIFLLDFHWKEISSDVFEDCIFPETGLSKRTVERYIRVWKMLTSGDVPKQIMDELQSRPIKDLEAISDTWASGFPIEESQWKELVEAPDTNTVAEQLRNIKGVPPRSNSLVIKLQRDGSLRGYTKSENFFIGYLAVEEITDNPNVEKAINRIVNSAGILKE